MKYILLGMIGVYQMIPGPWHSYCKHIPTCSNYAIESIRRYGSIKGTYLSVKRILKCNPFTKLQIDLVPQRSEKK